MLACRCMSAAQEGREVGKRTGTRKSYASLERGDSSRYGHLAPIQNYSRGALPEEHIPIARRPGRGLQTNSSSQTNHAIKHIDFRYLKSFEKKPQYFQQALDMSEFLERL